MQFVAKQSGTDALIPVEVEQAEDGVYVRVAGVIVMECLHNQQEIKVYTHRLASHALTVHAIDDRHA